MAQGVGTPGSAAPRGRVVVPQMPYFEPSTDPSAKATLLSQQVNEHDHFTFPANRDFWNNFVTQLRQYPGAREPPHYHVDASHTRESVLVNKEFLRRFVSGWEKANPHFVTVVAPMGQAKFQGSEDFWNRFVNIAGQRRRARLDRGELDADDTVVTSSLHPNQPPVRTTELDWTEICRSWDDQYRNIPTRQHPSQPPLQGHPSMDVGIGPPGRPALPSPQPYPADGGGGGPGAGGFTTHDQLMLPSRQISPEPTSSPTRGNVAPDSPRAAAATYSQPHHSHPAPHLDHIHQAQGKQIDELQRMLASMTHQASVNKNSTDVAQREADQLRAEKESLAGRVKKLEEMLSDIQSDVALQKELAQKELERKDKELEEYKSTIDLQSLKKELELREAMQDELLRNKDLGLPPGGVGALPYPPGLLPDPHMSPHRAALLPPHALPPGAGLVRSPYQVFGQRTVATQTPPTQLQCYSTYTDGVANIDVPVATCRIPPGTASPLRSIYTNAMSPPLGGGVPQPIALVPAASPTASRIFRAGGGGVGAPTPSCAAFCTPPPGMGSVGGIGVFPPLGAGAPGVDPPQPPPLSTGSLPIRNAPPPGSSWVFNTRSPTG